MKKKYLVFGTIACAVLLIALMAVTGFAATSSTTFIGECATGSTTATGAAINVSTGFTPRSVLVSNIATTTPVKVEWFTGMTTASALRTLASSTASLIVTRITVSGVSAYAGSTSAAKGFTIGADTTLNISGDTLYYKACR